MELPQLVAGYAVILIFVVVGIAAAWRILRVAICIWGRGSTDAHSRTLSPKYLMVATAVLILISAIYYILSWSFDEPQITTRRSSPNNLNAILFIHGWHGKHAGWDTFLELLESDAAFENTDIYLLTYPALSAFVLSARGADPLENAVQRTRRWLTTSGRYRNVALVGHSVGGVIARATAVDASHEVPALRWILSFGSPFAGSDMARGGTDLLGLPGDVLAKLHPGSQYLTTLNRRWDSLRLKPLRPLHACLASTGDHAVLTSSATHGCDKEHVLIVHGASHHELVMPLSRSDERYKFLRERLAEP